jgi:PAS domain S-box-containing protein
MPNRNTRNTPVSAGRKAILPPSLPRGAEEDLIVMNERLVSVNEAVHLTIRQTEDRNRQLQRTSADLSTIFTSFNIALIAVDRAASIRHFNAEAQRIFNLQPSDIGRKLGELSQDLAGVEPLVEESIKDGRTFKEEFQDPTGAHRLLRVHPSRSDSGSRDGAVLVFTDVHELDNPLGRTSDLADSPDPLLDDRTIVDVAVDLDAALTSMLDWISMLRSGRLSREQTESVLAILERNTEAHCQRVHNILINESH